MKFEYIKHKVAPFDVRYPDGFEKFIKESLQPVLIYDRHSGRSSPSYLALAKQKRRAE